MTNLIQSADIELLQAIPERDLVEMAIDLEIRVPEQIQRMDMITQCILAIVDRAKMEGLPLSQYDKDDLEALNMADLKAIGELLNLAGPPSIDKILKKGRKVYKMYQRYRPDNATALLIPTLLPLIARAAGNQKIE